MKTLLLNGSTLNEQQLALITFKGAAKREWVVKHSFYFQSCGTKLSENPKEYYPVLNASKNDVNPLI